MLCFRDGGIACRRVRFLVRRGTRLVSTMRSDANERRIASMDTSFQRTLVGRSTGKATSVAYVQNAIDSGCGASEKTLSSRRMKLRRCGAGVTKILNGLALFSSVIIRSVTLGSAVLRLSVSFVTRSVIRVWTSIIVNQEISWLRSHWFVIGVEQGLKLRSRSVTSYVRTATAGITG